MSRNWGEENSSLDYSSEMCIKLRSNNTSEIWGLFRRECLLHIVVTTFGHGLHSTPLKWSKDQTWEPRFSSYIKSPLWGISTSWSLSHLTQMILIKTRVRREWRHTQELNHNNNTHTSQKESAIIKTTESQLKNTLKSLSNETIDWSRSLRVKVCSRYACVLL
jgi:hypothetical protein